MSRLEDLIEIIGQDKAIDALERAISDEVQHVLTIVSNKGVHHFPGKWKRGEVYYASEGNLDFSNIDSVKCEYESILGNLASKLKSKRWTKIYIVPFGHSTLSMQIKLLVYRVTRIETVDLFYDGKGNYYDLEIDQRDIIVKSPGE